MPLHVVISELLPSGDCELTGKSSVECVRVRLAPETPEAVIATKDFLRILRFRNAQQSKIDRQSDSDSEEER